MGYYIEIGVYPAQSNTIEFSFSIFGNCGIDGELMFNTRKDATEYAIKKANEIYNESKH